MSLSLTAFAWLASAPLAAQQVCTTTIIGNDDFLGISGSSDGNVIGVGKKGAISRYDGSNWTVQASPTNEELRDVEVVDATTAFAVGKDGEVLIYDGASWTRQTGVTNRDLNGVWAASGTEAYVVGERGEIWRYDGTSWSDESTAAGTNSEELRDAWGDGASFYALDRRGVLYRYDRGSGTWDAPDTTCRDGGGNFQDLWGDAAGNIYLVSKKEVYRYDGSSCPVVATGSENLFGIYGSPSGEIYAVGKDGSVLAFDGTTWQETTEAQEDLRDDWVSDGGTLYIAGKKGELTICAPAVPQIVADWYMDDCDLGLTGAPATDSGPNGLDGVTVGGTLVENVGQVCAAVKMNGSDAWVSVADDPALDLTDAISIAAWVRHDATPLENWETIVAKGDNAYRLHLNGGCNRTGSAPGNTRYGFTLGLNGGCNNADLNSNIVPQPGVWYHVAATFDGSEMRIYVNGALASSTSYSATIGSNNFDLGIGENTQQRGRNWAGDIDEVTIWDSAISAADVSDHMNRTRPCTNCGIPMFVINHDNYGIRCLDEPVAVTVVDSVVGTPQTGFSAVVALDTGTGRGGWQLLAGSGLLTDADPDDGVAYYDWPMGESDAVFALSYPEGATPIDIEVYVDTDPAVRDDDTEGPLAFSPSAFVLTDGSAGNPPIPPVLSFASPQVAGVPFPVTITAYGQTPDDPVCGVIESYAGAKSLELWFGYDDPSTGTIAPTVNGVTLGAGEAVAATVPVAFTDGQAVVDANYKDVGRIQLLVKDMGEGNPELPTGIRGATAGFVVKPYDFILSGIQGAGGEPNPEATGPTDPVFIAAGRPFAVTVTSVDADGDPTPNYGQESIPETVRPNPLLIAPAGGNNPAVGFATGFGAFTNGQASGNDFFWPEVGIIQLSGGVGDGSYFDAGDVPGSASVNVGRFVPDHFGTVLNDPSFATACTVGGYTYLGQPFTYQLAPEIDVTARAADGVTTTLNYAGDFWKLATASLGPRVYAAATGTLDESGLPGVDPVVIETGPGVGLIRFSAGAGLRFDRSAPVAAFDAEITLQQHVRDADGVQALVNPVVFGAGGGIAFDSGAAMRYGRVALGTAVGSELVNLPLPMRAEYYAGDAVGFVVNTDDACSDAIDLSLSGPVTTCVLDAGSPGLSGAGCAAPAALGERYREPPAGGDFNLRLAAPGAGNQGQVTVTADVPAWLEYDWDAAVPGDEDPTGVASFGVYPGEDRTIYLREVY